MKRPKSILLDYDLLVDLYVYTCRHSEPEDLQYMRIETGVRKKLEAMMRHDLYSLYKSGADDELREKARQEYLNAIGFSASFRWLHEQDVNVMRSESDTC